MTTESATPTAAATDWSDYWRKEGAGGEVFVGAGNARNEHLASFWAEALGALPAGARVLDVACGAGSVFAALPAQHGLVLVGSDLSDAALEVLRKRLPETETVQAPATELPFGDGEFQAVVSQFGVEYAGLDAFGEAARVIAPGGRLLLLCHCENGYVDARTRPQLDGALAARDSGFALKAADLIRAMAAGNAAQTQRAVADFKHSETQLASTLADNPGGIHAHLYAGFQKLFNERRSYTAADILKWLSDVSGEVGMAIARLSHMHDAAMDSNAIAVASDRLQSAGLQLDPVEQLTLPEHDLPLAWRLSATRPAA